MNLADLTDVASRRPLTEEESAIAMRLMADGVPTPTEIKAFLMTPSLSVEEVEAGTLTGLVRVVRERAIPSPGIRWTQRLDTCGTGGGVSTFNISTAAAFTVAAAAGEPDGPSPLCVCKHGNRAVASKSGSADVLEQCGFRIDLSPEENVRALNASRFAFFFAQKYHTAFRHVMPVRKELAAEGRRTAFNLVGPLANPSGATHQVVGIFLPSRLDVVAQVLRSLGVTAALVAGGSTEDERPLDEISICGSTSVRLLRNGAITSTTLAPEDFGLERASSAELEGGDPTAAAAALRGVLERAVPGDARERAVVINAAAALALAGFGDWRAAADTARVVIADGRALRTLERAAAATHAA